ncbi:MAG: hypothetical protein CVU03_09285 [Bacteroidetes bacterium HGW-Bacteroidetes-2]|jgi:hypothetical protein|nr:MAG: hypothetical protein CVU03_09285 [Bacteroidetes bacterium HGW-Bacteroidetes-2]
MTQKILFNILTRSSKRPIGFNKCHDSIKLQSYKKFKHYVSIDNQIDLEYLQGKDVIIVKIKKQCDSNVKYNENGNRYAPYNLYCNELLEQVQDGWILFLDDDDNLLHNKVLKELVKYIKKYDEDTLFIWQMRYPNGKVVPSNELIKKRIIKINNIGSPCFMFHFKYKDMAKWDSFKGSDFRFINQLTKNISKQVFINKVFIQINNFGDLGNKNDIIYPNLNKLPFAFNKNLLWYFIPKYHFKIFNIYFFSKITYLNFFNKIIIKIKYIFNKSNS